jgi:hypothetical protein
MDFNTSTAIALKGADLFLDKTKPNNWWDNLSNDEFLDNRYQFWFDRGVGQEGLDYWGKELEGGMSRYDINKSIGKSNETQDFLQNVKDVSKDYRAKGWDKPSSITSWDDISKEIRADAREMTPLGGNNFIDSITPAETPTETPVETPTSSGGGGYKGPSLDDFRSMLNEMFSNPWTPVGFGWGGTNSDAVRVNKSQGSRRGSSYSGNNSSFNRSGSRLNSDTLWMNTLGE